METDIAEEDSRTSGDRALTLPARMQRHVGLIPDGNRRWAESRGGERRDGYPAGIEPGLALLEACPAFGIKEVSVYGYTKENTHRPGDQVGASREACVEFALRVTAGLGGSHFQRDRR